MSKKSENIEKTAAIEPSHIQTTTTIRLITRNGVWLFDGKNDAEGKIAGLNRYASKVREAWNDSKKGWPWANLFLLQTEERISVAKIYLEQLKAKFESTIAIDNYSVSKPINEKPTVRTIASIAPYPYKVGQLIVLADHTIAQVLMLRHNGFITEDESKIYRKEISKSVRGVLEHSNRYPNMKQYAGKPENEIDEAISNRLGVSLPEEVRNGISKPKYGPRVEDKKDVPVLFRHGDGSKSIAAGN